MDHYYDRMDSHIEDMKKFINIKNNQRLAGLQLQAQQPCLAVKADVIKDKRTRVRKEDAAPDERFGNISSARVDDDRMS